MTYFEVRSRKANPVSMNALLKPVVKNIGMESTLQFDTVFNNWEYIVGSTNAKNTKPLSIKDGVLAIAVTTPAWLTQARYYKKSFINKVNNFEKRIGALIHDIHFIAS